MAAPINNPATPDLNASFPEGIDFVQSLVPALVGAVFLVGIVSFFAMFVIGGIQLTNSGGDKGALEQARGRISSALIGIVVLFGSFAIINFVEYFFNINILTIDIGPLKIQ